MHPSRSTAVSWKLPAVLAVVIVILTSVVVFLWTEYRIQSVLDSFGVPATGQGLPADAFGRLVPRMEKQKEQYSSWAYTALAAIIAISVVKRVLPSPWIRWTFMILGPAAVLLLQTLRAGVYFDQRLTFLSVRGSINEPQFVGVQTLLAFQFSWLSAGLVLLLLFVSSFIVAIVAGRLDLTTKTGDN